MTARRPAISLHIERLVLDGLPLTAAQGSRVQASLERELTRLISARRDAGAWSEATTALAATALAAPRSSPPVVWEPTRPGHLGRALARSVFASLDRGTLGGFANPPAAGPRGSGS